MKYANNICSWEGIYVKEIYMDVEPFILNNLLKFEEILYNGKWKKLKKVVFLSKLLTFLPPFGEM